MRRVILEDPQSRAAIWSRNLALFALVVAIIGVALARKGLDPVAALAVVGGALALAGLGILCAVVAMVVIWQHGYRGVGIALGGLLLSGLLFVYPAYLAVQARTVPPVADVSTDLADPPTFLASDAARSGRSGSPPPGAMSEADKALQRKLYPDLQSISLDAEAIDAEALVVKLIKRRRWSIVDEVQPIRFATGHIDVVVKSTLMGFPADLTVRIRGLGTHTQVDVRSVARGGWQEPGSNAARVRALVADIEAANDES